MFEIEYKGGNGVVISTKKTVVAIDPKISVVGLKDVKTNDAVELGTESRFLINNSENKIAIEGPGEYEIGDVAIKAAPAKRHLDHDESLNGSTIYRLEIGDVAIAVLGNIAPKLTEDQLETIGVVDILIIPVGGGGYTLDSTAAVTMTKQIEPKVVIPIHYEDSGVRYEVPQESLDGFVKQMNTAPFEETAKYKLKNSAALPEALTIVKVSRS